MEPPRARITHFASIVRGEDRKASETLDSFQKIVDLDFGVAVVAIVDLGAFAKQRVRFVEQKDRAALLCRIENPSQIPLRLANVFAHHLAHIDAVQVRSQLAGQSVGGHERPRRIFADEQQGNALGTRRLGIAYRLRLSAGLSANGRQDSTQGRQTCRRQAQIGFEEVFRIDKDFPVRFPHSIFLAPLPLRSFLHGEDRSAASPRRPRRRQSPQAPSAPRPRRVRSPEDGSGTRRSRLSPRFGALPAAAASNQLPCVEAPMEAPRNCAVSPAMWLASGLLPNDTLKTFWSPLL